MTTDLPSTGIGAGSSSDGRRALVIEDEDVISMLTEDMLRNLGFEIGGTATNLSDGLTLARDETFDLAVVDMNLNGQMSFPIATCLQDRRVPFVFATGYSDMPLQSAFVLVPILRKPFTIDHLRASLLRVLPDRRHRQLGRR
jgi:CheY-like chemotaxis protein